MVKKRSSRKAVNVSVDRVEVNYRVNDPDPQDILVTATNDKHTYFFENGPTAAQLNQCFKKVYLHARSGKGRFLKFWIRDGHLISDPKPRKRKRSKA